MHRLVIAPQVGRFKEIENHLQTVKDNRSNLDFVKEVLESDGFQVYFIEVKMNAVRLRTEIARIERIAATYVKKKRDEANDQDSTDEKYSHPGVPMLNKFCRSLDDIKNDSAPSELQTLYNQLGIYRK